MTDLLPPLPLLLAFLAAAVVLAVTPGPGVLYIVARTLSQGRARGLASVAGVALGNLANVAVASIGLAALLAGSDVALAWVRMAGAAYLCLLGVQALRRPRPAATAGAAPDGLWQVLVQGFLVALLNPKTTLFFAAFLPQFMQASAPTMLQGVVLGAIFVAIAAVSDAVYVLLASAMAATLPSSPGAARLGRMGAALTYLALGVYAALAGARPGKV